ncbi:formate dehydrogenase accessory sulfurtransferase FdhD [Hylemonella gracilis]|uniref:Sulfur carrier protein FdhD n=1 Tax=Hylemonella gracilis ATCC 19624 TaxID=887062 RepID=F3KRR0_9BURK|nr:formate dehydrogenase accessory sulfurtransferase FdhD [Hylemonella gracilis]EGI77511.1 formate dehydrogenase family accessory protein FdhD [Hylemonella gracilis ATCC 19624]
MKLQDLPPQTQPRAELAMTDARKVPVTGLHDGQVFQGEDWVAEECPVALVYNGISHAVMLATPADLEDFALGFSLSEGIVDSPAQVYGIEVQSERSCDGQPGLSVNLDIASACFARLKERRRTLAGRTGCGLCGTDSLDQAVRAPSTLPKDTDTVFRAAAVSAALGQMRERQRLLGITGATHAAAWCSAEGAIALLREDVGRHNALDKLIGALSRPGVPVAAARASEGFIIVSSRASYEMVQKTASAGVTLLAAVSGVTGLAVDVAQGCGLTLLGFARGQDLSVYSQPQRIVL